MDLHKFNPWNWFKHEQKRETEIVPVKRGDYFRYPLANIGQIHNEIDRLFDNMFQGYSLPAFGGSELWDKKSGYDFFPAFSAHVNVASDDEKYIITLEAPGLENKDMSIELRERVLVIKGNKKEEQENKDKHYYRVERHYGAFERVLNVPDDANVDQITARMEKGLLTINIPRIETEDIGSIKNIEILN